MRTQRRILKPVYSPVGVTRTEAGLRAFEPTIVAGPTSVAGMLAAVDFAGDTPKEIVIVTHDGASEAQELIAILRKTGRNGHDAAPG